jgi:hypothetical protein
VDWWNTFDAMGMEYQQKYFQQINQMAVVHPACWGTLTQAIAQHQQGQEAIMTPLVGAPSTIHHATPTRAQYQQGSMSYLFAVEMT